MSAPCVVCCGNWKVRFKKMLFFEKIGTGQVTKDAQLFFPLRVLDVLYPSALNLTHQGRRGASCEARIRVTCEARIRVTCEARMRVTCEARIRVTGPEAPNPRLCSRGLGGGHASLHHGTYAPIRVPDKVVGVWGLRPQRGRGAEPPPSSTRQPHGGSARVRTGAHGKIVTSESYASVFPRKLGQRARKRSLLLFFKKEGLPF